MSIDNFKETETDNLTNALDIAGKAMSKGVSGFVSEATADQRLETIQKLATSIYIQMKKEGY